MTNLERIQPFKEPKRKPPTLRLYKGKYPSVTTVLDVLPKGHLDAWKDRTPDHETIMLTAQNHGTQVHKIAERIAKGEHFTVPPDMLPFANAIREFLSKWVSEVLDTELSLVSEKHGFGGTCDMYVRLKNGTHAVVDFKTTKRGLTRQHGLQAAAYALLLQESGRPVNRRLVVWIKKTPGDEGKWYCREYKDHRSDLQGFLGALALWKWTNKSKLDKLLAQK